MNDLKPKTKIFRGIAAATLAVWLVAQFFCTLHCTTGASSLATVSAAKDCCHKNRAHHPAENSTPTACFAFKLLAPTQNLGHDLGSPEHLQPIAAILLAEIFSVFDFESPSNPRPAPRPDRVIAHEVSLGSAARAHAPPFFA